MPVFFPLFIATYMSGLDESLLSSASLFGDADATSFNRFMNEHVRHYMLEEEVRARHQVAMLKLREKALKVSRLSLYGLLCSPWKVRLILVVVQFSREITHRPSVYR